MTCGGRVRVWDHHTTEYHLLMRLPQTWHLDSKSIIHNLRPITVIVMDQNVRHQLANGQAALPSNPFRVRVTFSGCGNNIELGNRWTDVGL